tara:strand:+ start:5256 stop:5492 length:237 start_codon:yes stop_codon:yes gene_type:complete
MKTIKNIISKLQDRKNKTFTIQNLSLEMDWDISFEFENNSIYMITNGSTLTQERFESLKEVNCFLLNTFLTEKAFTLK